MIPANVGFSVPVKGKSEDQSLMPTIVNVDGIEVGGTEVVIIAGPCAVESQEQLFETARAVKKGGARILRGGAFKPRSSPYSFQGLGEEGLKLLSASQKRNRIAGSY